MPTAGTTTAAALTLAAGASIAGVSPVDLFGTNQPGAQADEQILPAQNQWVAPYRRAGRLSTPVCATNSDGSIAEVAQAQAVTSWFGHSRMTRSRDDRYLPRLSLRECPANSCAPQHLAVGELGFRPRIFAPAPCDDDTEFPAESSEAMGHAGRRARVPRT